jgi:hypothetical protein
MHRFPASLIIAAILFAAPAQAFAPPREESPVSREMLEAFGEGSSDEELARAIAAAEAYPLGSLQNPVRIGGPEGAFAYLARLRCADGSAPKIGTKSAGGVGAFGSITEVYPVDCGAAGPARTDLAFDLYHEGHVENRPPPGLRITPAQP